MITQNSKISPSERNPSAEDSARSVTALDQSIDKLIEALGDKEGPRFRKLIEAMPDDGRRKFMDAALLVLKMDSEQLARLAKHLADEPGKGGDL